MSKSWRNSWGADLKVRESRGDKSNDWRKEYEEEMAEPIQRTVHIIMNEWQPFDTYASSTEIVGGNFFFSEDDAWEALKVIAEAHSVDLHPDDTSFEPAELASNFEFDSYYIMELTHG